MLSRIQHHLRYTNDDTILTLAAQNPKIWSEIFNNCNTKPEHIKLVFKTFPKNIIREQLGIRVHSLIMTSELATNSLETLVIEDGRIDYAILPYLNRFGLTAELAENIYNTPRLKASVKIRQWLHKHVTKLDGETQERIVKEDFWIKKQPYYCHFMVLKGTTNYIENPTNENIENAVEKFLQTAHGADIINSFAAAAWKDSRFLTEVIKQLAAASENYEIDQNLMETITTESLVLWYFIPLLVSVLRER